MFSSIFVADTKIIYDCDFVAPLSKLINLLSDDFKKDRT